MKHILTIFLAISGFSMLVVGYTAPARARAAFAAMENARITVAGWDAQRAAVAAAKDAAAEYAETVKRIEAHNYPTPQDELVKAIGKAINESQKELLKGQKNLLDNMTDSLEESSVKTRGAIQYCAGWLLIAAACIAFAFGRNGKASSSPSL